MTMPDSDQSNTHSESSPAVTRSRSAPYLVDWLLMFAACSSAIWAVLATTEAPVSRFRRTVELNASPSQIEATWYIDASNVIHWPTGSAAGEASLRYQLSAIPPDVRVLVHPESLVEPLARTVNALESAGARQVHIAESSQPPFPLSDGGLPP